MGSRKKNRLLIFFFFFLSLLKKMSNNQQTGELSEKLYKRLFKTKHHYRGGVFGRPPAPWEVPQPQGQAWRVFQRTGFAISVACVISYGLGFYLNRKPPHTVNNAEWQEATQKRREENRMDPIKAYKIGTSPLGHPLYSAPFGSSPSDVEK